MIVVGSSVLQRTDGSAIHSAVATISQNARVHSGCGDDWRVLNVLHRVGNQLNILHSVGNQFKELYNLGYQ